MLKTTCQLKIVIKSFDCTYKILALLIDNENEKNEIYEDYAYSCTIYNKGHPTIESLMFTISSIIQGCTTQKDTIKQWKNCLKTQENTIKHKKILENMRKNTRKISSMDL